MKNIKYLFLLFLGLFTTLDIISAENIGKGSYTRINPEYKDLYKEDELESLEPSLDLGDSDVYYESINSAGIYVRNELLKGYTDVIFGYKSTTHPDYIKDEVEKIIDKVEEHTGVPNQGDYIRSNSLGYQTLWSYYTMPINGKYEYAIRVVYYPFTTKAEEDTLDARIKSVMASLKLNGKTEYQKVSAIYDYITSHVTYDYDSLDYEVATGVPVLKAHSAYNAMMYGTSVCQGYALLFYRMALEAGIDARYIGGDAGGPHAWNIAKIGKYYYNLDSTWDAGLTKYNYFLRNNANFKDHVRDPEYLTSAFNKKYPMSPNDYKEEVALKGDISGDGKIELTDVLMLLKAYFNNSSTLNKPVCDMNSDGKADLTDVLMLLKVYFTNN